MSNLPSPDSAIFTISPDQKARYDAQFRKFLPSGDFMSGEQAKGIMLQSGLPPMVLANVWSLADVDADGRMDINEFSIALHLIALKLKGIEVPRTLPTSLKVLVEPPPAFAAFNDPPPAMVNNTPARGLVHSSSSSISGSPAAVGMAATKMQGSMGNLVGQAAVASSPKMSASAEWTVPQPSKLKYTQLFNSNDRARSGFLTGPQARNILLETKLPQAKLAQVWNLADVDADGKLTCEEFVLAMHLIDKVRASEPLPAKLPPDLVPPSYRRVVVTGGGAGAGTGTLSHGSSLDDPASDSDMLKNSFEDKRRENYEKGQAELDRRRAAMAEQQKREREERERKEREENARREKERLEAERRKQEELERQQQLIREKELEKEEAKRRQSEVRELARREMERQRQREIEQTQRQELINVRSRLQEEVLKLKSRRKALKIEHEQAEKRIAESKAAAQASRDKVVRVKADIDGMRSRRDGILARQAATKEQMKALTDRQLFIEQEKVKLSAQLKTLFANASNGLGSSTADQMTSFASMLQAKQLAINQLRAHVDRYESEYKTKREDVRTGRQELEEMKRRFERKRQEAKAFADRIEAKRQEAERLRELGADAARSPGLSNATTAAPAFSSSDVEVMSVPQFDWGSQSKKNDGFSGGSAAPSAGSNRQPSSLQTKFKYQCIYEFEARNKDEISIKPGDIIMVDTSAASEPEWLSGEVNGKVGWFPQGYAELIDENGDSAMAVVDNEPKPLDAAWGAASVDNSAEVAAAEEAAAASSSASATAAPAADSSFTATASANTTTLKTARALYDWTSTEQGHLNFTTGELIRITEYQDTWYYGELVSGAAAGWFPESYVEIVAGDVTADQQPPSYYVGLYAFESQEKGDLEFGEGELVLVEKKDGEWWTGVIVDRTTGQPNEARRGIFPSNFVGPATAADIPSSVSSAPKPAAAASATPAAAAAPVVSEAAPATSETKTHQRLDRKESDLSTSGACESLKPKKGKAKAKEIVTAIAAYTASGPEQLTLEVGQLIVVRKKMASGWWEGELTAKGKKKQVGWFPASYVKALGGVAATAAAAATGGSAGSSARSTPDPAVAAASKPAAPEEPEIERVTGLYSFKAEREDEISVEPGDTVRVLSKPDPTWWRGHNTRTGAIGLFPSNHVQKQGADGGGAVAAAAGGADQTN